MSFALVPCCIELYIVGCIVCTLCHKLLCIYPQIQGTVYEDVGQITPGQLSLALESVMKTLVDLHAIHWHPMHDATQYLPFDRTQSFWEDEVRVY